MSAVIEKVRSAKSGLTEACASLLTGFEASLLAAAARTAEISGLKRDLERSEGELGFLKRQLEDNKGAFADLPRGISDAVEFYRAKEGSSTEKLFWSQYIGAKHPMPLSDQLKQLVELHKAAELAMKDLIVRMWPREPLPSSYFGLVKRLVNACPRLEAIKRSVCIEGARRSFARAKVHWAKMDAEKLVIEGPPEGKEHRHPERYYDSVLKGARLVAEECAKDVIFG
ncbi:hypothetical protein VPH35_072949 [Triticum aestivum]